MSDLPHMAEDLGATREAIESRGVRSTTAVADVTVLDDVRQLVAATVTGLGSLDVMVANAGVVITKPTLDVTPEEYDRVHAGDTLGGYRRGVDQPAPTQRCGRMGRRRAGPPTPRGPAGRGPPAASLPEGTAVIAIGSVRTEAWKHRATGQKTTRDIIGVDAIGHGITLTTTPGEPAPEPNEPDHGSAQRRGIRPACTVTRGGRVDPRSRRAITRTPNPWLPQVITDMIGSTRATVLDAPGPVQVFMRSVAVPRRALR